MKNQRNYFVYIATNHPRHTVLYVGVSNNVLDRDNQHRIKLNKNSFSAKYNVNKIVYYETYNDIRDAIAREKQIKSWPRKRKMMLIESINPEWKDLIKETYG